MKTRYVYLKAEQNVKVSKDKVYLGDIFKVYCDDDSLKQKLNAVLIYNFTKKSKNRAVISVLKAINAIKKVDSGVEIISLGENDIVIECIKEKQTNTFITVIKVIFVSLVCFFGTAFTLMAFHNDINVAGLMQRTYEIFGMKYPGGLGVLEIGYSLGLGAGIIIFYNHLGKRRITKDPTPLEVEMRIYENDVNQTLIENAGREGIEVDVD